MGTCNFRTPKNFPLYVMDDIYAGYCDECDVLYSITSDEKCCPECGAVLRDIDYDYGYMEETFDSLESMAESANVDFRFHNIIVESGYYTGVQLDVDEIENPENLDNYDCNYNFGMCRSKAIRAYHSEQNKVRKALKKIAEEVGMEEIVCLGVFSNGEAIYQRAN